MFKHPQQGRRRSHISFTSQGSCCLRIAPPHQKSCNHRIPPLRVSSRYCRRRAGCYLSLRRRSDFCRSLNVRSYPRCALSSASQTWESNRFSGLSGKVYFSCRAPSWFACLLRHLLRMAALTFPAPVMLQEGQLPLGCFHFQPSRYRFLLQRPSIQSRFFPRLRAVRRSSQLLCNRQQRRCA